MQESLGIELGTNVPTLALVVHLAVATVFFVAAALSLAAGGALLGVALQTTMGALVAGLGISVARLV